VAPALSNPALRELRERRRLAGSAFGLAATISLAAASLTACYAVLLWVAREWVLELFGTGFDRFANLIIPIALTQFFAALALGFSLLIKVDQRGPAFLPVGVLTPAAAVIAGSLAAWQSGLEAAAWAIAASSALSPLWAASAAWQRERRTPQDLGTGHARIRSVRRYIFPE
jgi:hypothetical protein